MNERVAVIVQCRLSSTRLPGKALKDLGGAPTLAWTLDAMKKVRAERYFLACDFDSQNELRPIAQNCGWEIFAGDRDDVLKRFCDLIETQFPECEIIVRATADNPFLFYEAAALSVTEFVEKYSDADYFTFTGLPHGSGVELFKAPSLLKARALTDSPYDHEHVGPALYNHPENFKAIFAPANENAILSENVIQNLFRNPTDTPRYEVALRGEKALLKFEALNLADLRTTIDTYADYKRVQNVAQAISNGKKTKPYSAKEILSAYKNPLLAKTVLFVPSVKAGRGTGHLRRCLNLAKENGGFVYVPQNATLKESAALLQEAISAGLHEYQIIRPANDVAFPKISRDGETAADSTDFSLDEMILHKAKWDLIVADLFKSDAETMQKLNALGQVCSIDDGGECDSADFLLDIIPSYNLKRAPNLENPALIPLPVNRSRCRSRKSVAVSSSSSRGEAAGAAKKALVVVSGESHDELALQAARALCENGFEVTVILGEDAFNRLQASSDATVAQDAATTPSEIITIHLREAQHSLAKGDIHLREAQHSLAVGNIHCAKRIIGLREELYKYDLVFTHYGFTAFEAVAAGCRVILAATSSLHKKLSKKYGFVCLSKREITTAKIKKLLQNPSRLTSTYFETLFAAPASASASLPATASEAPATATVLLETLSFAQKFNCPVCGTESSQAKTVARTKTHTFRRCPNCKMLYLAFSTDSRVQYEKSYFDSEYKTQYGRTYLEDFDSIKSQGTRRVKILSQLSTLNSQPPATASESPASETIHYSLFTINCAKRTLLDIGCAYGPFLAAAKDAGFEPYGSDISKAAVDYVKNTLGFKAVNASFADFDAQKEFGFGQFDAITMWYVIEHVQNLGKVLRQVNSLLKKGGVFAFSTPSGSGVSARFNKKTFFEQSPRDHYSIWEIRNTQNILKRFGFKIKKIVPTGLHPERIPFMRKLEKNHKIQKSTFLFSISLLFCKVFKLGDTYEVYCEKVGDAID